MAEWGRGDGGWRLFFLSFFSFSFCFVVFVVLLLLFRGLNGSNRDFLLFLLLWFV